MRLSKLHAAVLVTVFLSASVGLTQTASATAAETQAQQKFLTKLNAARTGMGLGALVTHAGLQAEARRHSRWMSKHNSLTHDQPATFATRFNAAQPDPPEGNGPPDDGFTSGCENIAYFTGSATLKPNRVAGTFKRLWDNSPGHHHCEYDEDTSKNVAGIGIDYRNGKWWATFDAGADSTPP